jgi:hypothetical protein
LQTAALSLVLALAVGCRGAAPPSSEPFLPSSTSPAATSPPAPSETPSPPTPPPPSPTIESAGPDTAGPVLVGISDNAAGFPDGLIPQYEKLEITFQVENTVAQNFQLPYDPAPPPGIDPTYARHQGITVDALFTPDNWQTVYIQPAFYFQDFEQDLIAGRPWLYPTDQKAWKVRFSPNQPGEWQYRLSARDASGTGESAPRRFGVAASSQPGFVRVSQSDPRYFEFDDGSPFHVLGFNLALGMLTPAELETLGSNGITLIRAWMAPLSIYGSAWNPYYESRNNYNGYVPRTGLLPFLDPLSQRETITLRLDWDPDGNTGWFDACRMIGQWGPPTEVKPQTRYRIEIRYWGLQVEGPRDPAHEDFGLALKSDLGSGERCFQPGAGQAITSYGGSTLGGWGTISGEWFSGDARYLPRMQFGLDNVTSGTVYVASFSLREILGEGQYGPEVMHKPDMEQHLYFQQHASFLLDQIVAGALEQGVYLKLVVLEKGEKIFQKIALDGAFAPDNRDHFYGDWRAVTKVRWLQQAWWRYLQARWGYSPSIHSWELLNEGDPGSGRHFALADEFGKYMHCRVFGIPVPAEGGARCDYDHPNDHLVTTSFWASFPVDKIWASPEHRNLDYADVHAYISTGWLDDPLHESDTAAYHLDYGRTTRQALLSAGRGFNQPIIRGEAGIDFVQSQSEQPGLKRDTQGVWLHNLLWASLDAGALGELYWWIDNLRSQPGPDGQPGLYEVFGYLRDFMNGIPLNDGHYQAAAAAASDPRLRIVGQMDPINARAHLWIQNREHTWRRAVDDPDAAYGLGGTVTLDDFPADTGLTITWHEFTTAGLPSIRTSSAATTAEGRLVLELPQDPGITDVGVKIEPAGPG